MPRVDFRVVKSQLPMKFVLQLLGFIAQRRSGDELCDKRHIDVPRRVGTERIVRAMRRRP